MPAAAVLTYDVLTTLIQSYLERTDSDVVEFIPYAIMLAESKLSNKLKQLGQQAVTRAVIQPSSKGINYGQVQKPTRWRKTISITYIGTPTQSDFIEIHPRSLEYCKDYAANVSNATKPKFYADYNFDYWFISPIPAVNSMFEVVYYERLEPLSSANQSNWITINSPEAMMYGTLLEMTPFIKNDPRIAVWEAKYREATDALLELDVGRIVDRSTFRQEQQG